MSIYPTSVEKIGKLMNLYKMDNVKVKSAGLTKQNMTKEDEEYCMRDCEIVYKALLRIFEMTGTIKITLPSLAMYDFRHNYIEESVVFSELVDEFYESYYGGRTEAFYIGKTDAKVFDVNSMYPKAMATVVLPDIKHLKKVDSCDVKYLMYCLERFEGMAKVTVKHKETFFGYLPSRKVLNKASKLVFPVGEFTTTVNFNELRYAVNSGVVEIKKVFYIIYGNPINSIFYDYINDNYNKRKESTDELERIIYKLKMNSLYGRFGMKLKMTTTYYESIPFNLINELKESNRHCDIKLFNSIRADCFLVTDNEKAKNAFFSIPAIASYITSEARVLLLKNLVANEKNKVVYCDTDSIFLVGDFVGTIGDELGDFKLEEKKIIEVNGLKNYKYIDADGKENVVIKGISRGSTKTKTTAGNQETYESQRYYKTKASLRQNKEAGQSYKMIKIVSNNYDKREVLDGGNTRALICRKDEFINATTFIRPKVKIVTKKQTFKFEPNNIREAVMVFFIKGGKVYTEDLKSHVTGRNIKEIRRYFGLHSKDGIHMDVFCELLNDEFYTDRIIDVFQDVLLSFHTKAQMKDYLTSQYNIEAKIVDTKLSEYQFEYDTPF
jgi:hypothetical protein